MRRGGEGREEPDVYGVRLDGWFAPFAALKGFEDVIFEVEEGVEV